MLKKDSLIKKFVDSIQKLVDIIFIKEVKQDMAVVYATLIIRGARTFAQVPVTLKEQVKQVLIDLEMGHLAE